jgi:DNA-binding NtrC family response regulator
LIRLGDLPPRFASYVSGESSDTVFEIRDDKTTRSLATAPSPAGESSAAAASAAMGSPLGPLKNFLRDQEIAYLNRAMAYTNGEKEKAASILGISLATLYRKLSEDNEAAG